MSRKSREAIHCTVQVAWDRFTGHGRKIVSKCQHRTPMDVEALRSCLLVSLSCGVPLTLLLEYVLAARRVSEGSEVQAKRMHSLGR